jgi:HEAT repeat protein
MGLWGLWWNSLRLRSPSESARLAAVRRLQHSNDPRAVPLLIRAIRDPNSSVEQAAVAALGEMRYREAVPALLALLADPRLAASASAALARIGDPETARQVADLLGGPQERPARDTLERMAATAVEPLIAKLGHVTATVRRAAAATLRKIGDPRAAEPLARVVNDTDVETRLEAALALALAGDQRAVPALLERLRGSTGYYASRTGIVLALGKVRNEEVFEVLVGLAGDEDEELRKAVREALQTPGWQPANPRQRASLAVALGRPVDALAEGPVAIPIFLHLLNDPRGLHDTKSPLVDALRRWVERHAGELADADLQALADLSVSGVAYRPTYRDICGWSEYAGTESYDTSIDCSQLRQVARQELIRRHPMPTGVDGLVAELNHSWDERRSAALRELVRRDLSRGRVAARDSDGLIRELSLIFAAVGSQALRDYSRRREGETLQRQLDDLTAKLVPDAKRLRDPRVFEWVEIASIDGKDRESRDWAARVLRGLEDVRSPEELLQTAVFDPRHQRRESARTRFLQQKERALPLLLGALRDGAASPYDPLAVIGLLRENPNPAAVDLLIPLLRDGRADVREAALVALAGIEDPRVIPFLVEGLMVLNHRTRHAVVAGLVRQGAAAVVPLLPLLRADELHARDDAARALGQIGDARAVPGLRALANDPSFAQRAVDQLAAVLSKAARDVAADDLRALARLGAAVQSDSGLGRRRRRAEPLPTLRSLAEAELRRRGLTP